MNQPLVSIIIPCYNAEKFLYKTIQSVVSQNYSNLEILCINDGSTDSTEQIINGFGDERINYLYKENSGVSDTRNKGIEIATGKYVVFLDSDDIFSPEFIEKRVTFLEEHKEYGFCSSRVIKINENEEVVTRDSRGPYTPSLLEDILLYKDGISTCPSIFMIRKRVLNEHNIRFNVHLSSSADRFFLIELSMHCSCGFIEKGAELYYRIHGESMSHKLTTKLVSDNRLYYHELRKRNYIPSQYFREFSFKINYIFAGSCYKLGRIVPCVLYASKAFFYNPSGFIKQLTK